MHITRVRRDGAEGDVGIDAAAAADVQQAAVERDRGGRANAGRVGRGVEAEVIPAQFAVIDGDRRGVEDRGLVAQLEHTAADGGRAGVGARRGQDRRGITRTLEG